MVEQFHLHQKVKWQNKAMFGPYSFEQVDHLPRHSVKLMDDILHRLNGAQFFTVVDSTSFFFNHKLDEESSKLTIFGTPYGRYRYLRMPMGASLSSDIYQYKVDGHLEGISQCVAIADDIIIYGFDNNGTYHNKTVRQVMQKAK